MATTLKTKNSVTAASAPSSLAQGELAVNITDKKMWVGNASLTPVQIVGNGVAGGAGGSTTQVQYNSSGVLAGSANMVFDGSTLTTLNLAYTGTLTGGTGIVNLGSGQFYKTSAGLVGIGTSSPSQKLTIGDSTTDAIVRTNAGVNNGSGLLMYYNSSFLGAFINAGAVIGGASITDPILLASTNLLFGTNSAERMRIDASGNVGIGNSSPSYRLDITAATSTNGVVAVRAGTNQASILSLAGNNNTPTSASFDLIQDQSLAYVYQRANSPMVFGTNNTERMRIDSTGKMLLGTTSTPGSTQLVVVGGTGIYNASGNSCMDQIFIASATSNSGTATTLFTITSLQAIVSVIFEVSCTNGIEPGYSSAKSTRQLLLTNYGGTPQIISSTETSNQQGSINSGVINTTIATSCVVSGSTWLLKATQTTTGAAGYTTNQYMVGKVTVTTLGTVTVSY